MTSVDKTIAGGAGAWLKALALVGAFAATAAAGAASIDTDFVKGLLAIPSESRSIPDCNRAVAYLRDYLEARGVNCVVERTEEGRDAIYASTVPGRECE